MLNVLLGVIGAVVATASVVLAWYLGTRSDRVSAAQQRIAVHQTAAEWQRDLRNWAAEAIDVLSEASYACERQDRDNEDCKATLSGCRHSVSALIDRGRFFLPNLPSEKGKDKPSAYRGWRHAALDPLVASERVLSGHVGAGQFKDRQAALVAMRREFVSSIQRILAPELYNLEIARMITQANDARATDATLGGLLPGNEVVPTGADRLLWGNTKQGD